MSARAVWVRALAGSWRELAYYYWITDPLVVPAWVATSTPVGVTAAPLLLDSAPQCASGTIDPLAPMASDTSLQFDFAASLSAIAVCAPDLAVAGLVRRRGFLNEYVSAAATVWEATLEAVIAAGDVFYVSGELVIVTLVTPIEIVDGVPVIADLTVTRGALGTHARAHSSPAADPTVLMDAARIPIRGQWVEYGVTDSGVDTVLWRGIVQSTALSSSQMLSMAATSMLSVLRQTFAVVPKSLPLDSEGATVSYAPYIPSINGGDLKIRTDEGEYPWVLWDYIRVIGRSGDWAIIDVSTTTIASLGGNLRILAVTPATQAPVIGSGDGVVRVIGIGSEIRVRALSSIVTRTVTSDEEAAAIRREHCISVLLEVESVEWTDLTTVRYCADVAHRLIAGTDMPPNMSPQLNTDWLVMRNVTASQVQYASASNAVPGAAILPIISPDGPIADWISGGLLRPGGLWMTADLGAVLIDTWQETFRTPLTVSLTTDSRDDRGPWGWSQKTKALLGVQFDDPTSSLEQVRAYSLGYGSRGSLSVRHRVTGRTVTSSGRAIVSADAWVSGQRFIDTVGTPLGISEMQISAWQSLIVTYGRELPVITSPLRESLVYVPGAAIAVELEDAPTTRALVGMVYEVTRDPSNGTMTVSVLLPGVGRDTLTVWAPTLTAAIVGAGTMTVSGEDVLLMSVYIPIVSIIEGPTLVVYTRTGELRGTLTDVSWVPPNVITWTGGTATPITDDILTLNNRDPVLSVSGLDGVVGYIAGPPVEYGDGRWQ